MNKLIKKYPSLFDWVKEEREKYPETPIQPIEFGIECGKGWYWLLDNLLKSIDDYCNLNAKIPPVKITQVKEKFGGLRVYFDGGDDLVLGMVWFAENLSYHICENCGSQENITYTTGWIQTICTPCLNKENVEDSES